MLLHFSVEEKFKEFIRESSEAYIHLNDTIRVTSDPTEANAFIIDHHTARIYLDHSDNCSQLFSGHLLPIAANVIRNYPYFNRSRGADHFYIDTFDTGTICADMNVFFENFLLTNPSCREDRRILIGQIRNVSFIGNYGMDLGSFVKGTQKIDIGRIINMTGDICHRVGKDIGMSNSLCSAIYPMHCSSLSPI